MDSSATSRVQGDEHTIGTSLYASDTNIDTHCIGQKERQQQQQRDLIANTGSSTLRSQLFNSNLDGLPAIPPFPSCRRQSVRCVSALTLTKNCRFRYRGPSRIACRCHTHLTPMLTSHLCTPYSQIALRSTVLINAPLKLMLIVLWWALLLDLNVCWCKCK